METCRKRTRINNFEKIKQMSEKNLALLLSSLLGGKCFLCPVRPKCEPSKTCREIMYDWLLQEVEK